ncbi:hypothetical protein [Helicobacter suis]|nr:hypothetical protein [Helicobacter suis]
MWSDDVAKIKSNMDNKKFIYQDSLFIKIVGLSGDVLPQEITNAC